MNRLTVILLLLVTLCASAMAKSKKSDETRVTVTYLVIMDKNAEKKISEALKEQDGIIESKIDTKKQEVLITFDAYKNTVSNLQNMFKELGYTANALEVGCFGSPEGCLNAKHYINNSMP